MTKQTHFIIIKEKLITPTNHIKYNLLNKEEQLLPTNTKSVKLYFKKENINVYQSDELNQALKEISSIIKRCKKIHPKFNKGTSQHTLLKNRIKAMNISTILLEEKLLIKEQDNKINNLSIKDLKDALAPVTSIINKCKKAQGKYSQEMIQFKRYFKLINAMQLARTLIEENLIKKEEE